MKKLIPLWSLLLLLLSGCGATASMVDLRDAPPPESSAPLAYGVSSRTYEESVLAEDGTVLGQVHFELPVLEVRRGGTVLETGANDAERQALEVAASFNSQFESWTNGDMVREMETWAREDYQYRPEFFTEDGGAYEEELTCSVYQTDSLISVAGFYYTYTGGAHPNSWMFGWNYDLDSGTFLSASALAEDSEAFRQAVAEEIIRQANQPMEDGTIPAEGYWEDYESIAADWSSYAVFFDEDGMTVVFSPYELACYAAGSQIFTISHETLRPWLSEYGVSLLGLEAE